MKSTDKLFRLIKSLSKNEKGYFKKVAAALSQSCKSNYLMLFETLDKMEDYDEQEVIKKLRKTSIIKQLPATKNYLYELLLKCLRLYNIPSSAQAEINALLENADILHAKGMEDEAIEMVKRAERIAGNFSNTFKRLEAVYAERMWLLDSMSANWMETVENNIRQADALIAIQHQQNRLYELYFKMMRFIRVERNVRNERQLAYLKELMSSDILMQNPSELSFSARINYLMVHKIYNQLINEDQKSYHYMKQVIDLYKDLPNVIKARPSRYLNALNNFFSICMKQYKHHIINQYISELEPWLLEYDKSNNYRLYEYKMESLMWKGDLEGAIELNLDARQNLGKKIKIIGQSRLVILTFNFMYFFHLLEMFEEAADMAAKLLDMKALEVRVDAHASARIFYVIFLYETKNFSVMLSALRAAKHFLKTRDSYHKSEQLILSALAKLMRYVNKTDEQKILGELLESIQLLSSENQLEKNFLLSCDIFPWIHSKIFGGKPIDYVLKRYREKTAVPAVENINQ